MYDDSNRLPRDVALELWTAGSAWFSSEQGKKGRLVEGQLADLVVLSKDYFSVPEEEIKGIESVLTVVDGKVVYAAGHLARCHRRQSRLCRNGRRW
jgi:predicted amidohydrolase YtcJ